MEKIPLLPRHKIYLKSFGFTDEKRFARLFRDGWARVPLYARRSILKYWRAYQALHEQAWNNAPAHIRAGAAPSDLILPPSIEVLESWPVQMRTVEEDGYEGGVFAQCSVLGYELRFWAPFVNAAPDEVVSLVVTHELSHVYTHSRGEVPEECDDEYLRRDLWCIDETAADEWIEQHSDKLFGWD
jgi:hypothetical protein